MSVIVPAFNEEAEIPTLVPAVRQALEARGGNWEIIVVDNASTDATVERMRGAPRGPSDAAVAQ